LRKLDKEQKKALREKEKKVGKETREGEKEFRKADEKEYKVAQKIYRVVIDKAERLEQEVGVADDVEDTESENSG
jgi:hypothetical protein